MMYLLYPFPGGLRGPTGPIGVGHWYQSTSCSLAGERLLRYVEQELVRGARSIERLRRFAAGGRPPEAAGPWVVGAGDDNELRSHAAPAAAPRGGGERPAGGAVWCCGAANRCRPHGHRVRGRTEVDVGDGTVALAASERVVSVGVSVDIEQGDWHGGLAAVDFEGARDGDDGVDDIGAFAGKAEGHDRAVGVTGDEHAFRIDGQAGLEFLDEGGEKAGVIDAKCARGSAARATVPCAFNAGGEDGDEAFGLGERFEPAGGGELVRRAEPPVERDHERQARAGPGCGGRQVEAIRAFEAAVPEGVHAGAARERCGRR